MSFLIFSVPFLWKGDWNSSPYQKGIPIYSFQTKYCLANHVADTLSFALLYRFSLKPFKEHRHSIVNLCTDSRNVEELRNRVSRSILLLLLCGKKMRNTVSFQLGTPIYSLLLECGLRFQPCCWLSFAIPYRFKKRGGASKFLPRESFDFCCFCSVAKRCGTPFLFS